MASNNDGSKIRRRRKPWTNRQKMRIRRHRIDRTMTISKASRKRRTDEKGIHGGIKEGREVKGKVGAKRNVAVADPDVEKSCHGYRL